MSSEDHYKEPGGADEGRDAGANSGTGRGVGAGANSGTGRGVGAGANSDTGHGVEPVPGAGFGSGASSGAGTSDRQETGNEQNPWKSTLSRWSSVIGWSLVSVSLILGVMLLLLQTPISKSFLKSQLEASFNQQFIGTLQIGSLEGFIPFQMRANEVVFSEQGEPVIQIASAGLQIDGSQLLRKELLITSFELERPVFEIRGTPSNNSLSRLFAVNEPASSLPDSTDFAFRLDFPAIRVLEGEVKLPTDWLPSSVPSDSLDASSNATGTHAASPHTSGSQTGSESTQKNSSQTATQSSTQRLTTLRLDALFSMTLDPNALILDADSARFSAPSLWLEPLNLSGVLFRSRSLLELDPFTLRTGESFLNARFSVSNERLNPSTRDSLTNTSLADDSLRGSALSDIALQDRSLGNAFMEWELKEFRLEPSLVRRWFDAFPETAPGQVLEGGVNVSGTGNHLFLDDAELYLGESSVRMDGQLMDLFGDSLRYSASVRQVVIDRELADALVDVMDAGDAKGAGAAGKSNGASAQGERPLRFERDMRWAAEVEGSKDRFVFGLMGLQSESSTSRAAQVEEERVPIRVSGTWMRHGSEAGTRNVGMRATGGQATGGQVTAGQATGGQATGTQAGVAISDGMTSRLDLTLEMEAFQPGQYVSVSTGSQGPGWLNDVISPLLLNGRVSMGFVTVPVSDGDGSGSGNVEGTALLKYAKADLRDSRWNTLPFDSLYLEVMAPGAGPETVSTDLMAASEDPLTASDGFSVDLSLRSDSTDVAVQGMVRLQEADNRIVLDGSVVNLDLEDLPLADTVSYQTDATFSMDLTAEEWSDAFGRLSMQFTSTRQNGMDIRPHQFYVDLNAPDSEWRELRFTSSMADARITGQFTPADLLQDLSFVAKSMSDRVKEEILLSSPEQLTSYATGSGRLDASRPWNLEGTFSTKDLSLLRSYLPVMPVIDTQAAGDFALRSEGEQLELSLRARTDTLLVDGALISNLRLSMDALLVPDRPIRERSEMAVLLSFDQVSPNEDLTLNQSSLDIQLRQEEFSIQTTIGELRDEFHLDLAARGEFRPDWIDVTLGGLVVKAPGYQFTAKGEPGIRYDRRQAITLREFVLEGADDFLSVDGTFSDDPDDYVTYEIRNLDLSGISDVIGGRIGFSGRASGDFSTRTLTTSPIFAGNILVEDGRLNGREVGDLSLESAYNPVFRQFDTEIHLYTDPARYSDYLTRYNTEGQDIFFYGYFKLPDEVAPDEDLFYFDADLKKLDMWFIREIIPGIMLDFEGQAAGQGFIRGGGTAFDFSATVDVSEAQFTPQFLNVEYQAEGELVFTYEDGLLFNDVLLTDRLGGTGTLNGQIDLDKFSPQTFYNLELILNDLRFMNNLPQAGVPFYGSMIGTGTASFTGDNTNPILRTGTPVTLSPQSTVSIPLDDGTSVEQSDGFIEFVESFDLAENGEEGSGNGLANGTEPERRFIDLFTMDLQFIAANPIQVDLVFDPLTNEVLNARGLGQLRIQLQDQDVNMFGQFNITGGSYQFVAGDIFTRRFTIQEGGSIQWQGDLESAALDVLAVYRTRPDLSTIIPSLSSSQRVPVELNLQIGGTISAIENDFYFRIPAGLEGTSDPTITTQINTLNQNEDSKVLQAFSILLTGEFLPADQAQTLGIGGNVTGTTALVNPLISSQIITPLLSNQINALLTSDIVLDVDVNLTTNRIGGNEGDQLGVDLDVALRLFDDRIIIRREGQIAGQQSNIGDLGATYRISRIFSVTAFHRQDPTLASRSDTDSQQSQEMNGVGFEARFQFHTWKALKENVFRFFKGLFGG